MSDRMIVYYVASTHWDREWYEPFQHFRHFLVEMLDDVLDTLQRDPRFTCFQTDGQAIVLEDYLEIRPERAAAARELARAGRLRLGPWYTLPDEFLVAPESLIRNLEEGHRVARGHGNCSKSGFVCDLFGHVSQLPQILQGFGIATAYVFRGVNEDTHRGTFRWVGADGSEVVTHRFGQREGYFDYACQVRNAWKADIPFTVEDGLARLGDYLKMQRERIGLDAVLLFDGGDHMTIEPLTPDVFERFHQEHPEVEFRHTGLDEYSAALVQRRAQVPRVCHGELREPGREHWDGTWVIPGVASSRIRLKQANRNCELGLTQWVEPFAHLASGLTGAEYPYSYIRTAWRHVLQNHAHDSICGCSPDQIHKDMEYRFDQARLINEKVTTRALADIADRVAVPALEGEQFALVVFNPTQAELNGPVDLELWFDAKTTSLFGEFFKYESKVGFRLYDAAGQELPYDYVSYAPSRRRFSRLWGKIPQAQECLVVTVTVPLQIPAFGYTTITCKPEAKATRHPAGGIAQGDRVLENAHLRVEVQDNGSLRLLDKHTQQTYDRLGIYEDRADIGDGWYHGVAVNDQVFSSTACPADVALVTDGRQKATLRITSRMSVPAYFEFGGQMRRSAQRAELVIDSYVTLRAGAAHVEVDTVIDNQVRDHRVRVLFETRAQSDVYYADSAFDVVERPIALPADNHTYKELQVETTPQASWTAVTDAARGLAIVAPHQPETAVRDVPERTLALTLLRGFRRTIYTDGEEGGQSLGRHEFHYRIVPLGGELPRTKLAVHAQALAGGTRAVQVLPRDVTRQPERTLPPTLGQLTLQPGLAVVTSLRRHPERQHLEVRAHNPHAEPLTEQFGFHPDVRAARVIDFEGNTLETLQVGPQGTVRVTLPPKKIVTLLLE
jgi:alpha-mannosidase